MKTPLKQKLNLAVGLLILCACTPLNTPGEITPSSETIALFNSSESDFNKAQATAAPTSPPSAEPTAVPEPLSPVSASPSPWTEPSPQPQIISTPTPQYLSAEEPLKGSRLTAGAWNDLENWDFWLHLMNTTDWKRMMPYWGLYPLQRVNIKIEENFSGFGRFPIMDQAVRLRNLKGEILAEGRTDQQGKISLFTHSEQRPSNPLNDTPENMFQIEIPGRSIQSIHDPLEKNIEFDLWFPVRRSDYPTGLDERKALSNQFSSWGNKEKIVLLKTPENINVADSTSRTESLRYAESISQNLDLMFMVDTTDSMRDELEYLKDEFQDLLHLVQKRNTDLQLRVSANFYRDFNNEYLVRSFPFSSDIATVSHQLSLQQAAGGGDKAEAFNQALENAIEQHAWSEKARARLLFLVLDAPPHRSTANLKHLHKLLSIAIKKGIRIIPIAGSGADEETEFLMRMLALLSNGEYLFLTSESGIGNLQGHLAPTTGAYTVEKLNALLLKIVEKYTQI
ncbi:hypothetical protein COW36_05130 [bacterium (Candidatus Blackallbacteria) CG17_big_fil_post_rev_8_21_14_2_50_48_46]|uniref:VWFA domain-containing protein n=1 Tax=bacterium (Candidatus Blackallbacteria) CG17_big_fil_post_rev_8_21_14_2_50_48_46 TaxID=2014261 RepID=A0A2M7G995_9BACT|nr:MAG: hypothetical protein COW36_05130 [bacterium (Candidatus Blackallbacteria) CG17_big_fil_post_rev_8_21_14_2_50_48_46]